MKLNASVLCVLTVVGCGALVGEGSSQVQPGRSEITAEDLRIEWQFNPSSEENALIRRSVYSLAVRDQGLDLSAVIVAYQLDGQDPRYLLVMRNRNNDEVREIVLYAIPSEGEGVHLSEAWRAAPDLLFGFAILELTDIDRDGWTDIVYCVWDDDEQDLGQRIVLGYRSLGWYVIEDREGCD